MSLLPGTILPPSEPIGSVNQDGTVTIDKNWWLLFYNLSNQTLGNGNGVPADQLVDLESADVDAIDSDAVSLRLPISNSLTQPPDVAPATSEYPDISRALLLAQDPPLQDVSPQAQPSATITVGGSPYSYTAPFNGCVVVTGGTVSAIAYVRQGTSIATGLTAGVFPVSRLDKVTVTYTGVPTMTCLPT